MNPLPHMLAIAGAATAALAAADSCAIELSSRKDCGFLGVGESECKARNCCWSEATTDGIPWCFYPSDRPAPPVSTCILAYNSTESPFTEDEVTKIRGYFINNLDIQGSGAVVAAPDHDTGPGGDYYFHWERDGALSMHAFYSTAEALDETSEKMQHYVEWVLKVQNQPNQHGIDVRTEPKYTIPSGLPYPGGWCRPQTDGPGLRAKTLAQYALALLDTGKQDFVKEFLWTGDDRDKNGGLVKHDLDWAADNWALFGCDLWEEIHSDDFFWGRYTTRAALHFGAQLAKRMGDVDSESRYLRAKAAIDVALKDHYEGTFISESSIRPKDSSVIEGINVGDLGDGVLAPLGKEALGTVIVLNDIFCNAYEINQKDTAAGIPGILYGRYEGDSYDGGNPWVLLTESLVILLYRQAAAAAGSSPLDDDTHSLLQKAYGISADLKGAELAQALIGAGDGVMLRVKRHVVDQDLHMSEQIHRVDGTQLSAKDLTWNYANFVKAMQARKVATAAVARLRAVQTEPILT